MTAVIGVTAAIEVIGATVESAGTVALVAAVTVASADLVVATGTVVIAVTAEEIGATVERPSLVHRATSLRSVRCGNAKSELLAKNVRETTAPALAMSALVMTAPVRLARTVRLGKIAPRARTAVRPLARTVLGRIGLRGKIAVPARIVRAPSAAVRPA